MTGVNNLLSDHSGLDMTGVNNLLSDHSGLDMTGVNNLLWDEVAVLLSSELGMGILLLNGSLQSS
jgi:hypothetical protein